MKYLVDARAGVGKSHLRHELIRRGFEADDGDQIPGLASWVDLATGQRTIKVDTSKDINESKTDWLWDEAVLDQWLSLPGDRFLCGSAGNDLEFFKYFSKVFVLTLKPTMHRVHLQKDKDRTYAKHPSMIEKKLAQQQEFVVKAIQLGAIAIDNNGPIELTADQILEVVHA